ncbi:MAG: transglycosylase SLT domain-containing protein [Alistipes senegalensis]|nr:transglycosylase SLT domain-containing protein [Alistipes senegalensis]
MKYTVLLLASLVLAGSTSFAAGRSPRKKDKTAQLEAYRAAYEAEQAAAVAAAVAAAIAVEPDQPAAAAPETDSEPVVNDITLGLTAEQADSLLAVWNERLRNDSFTDFFDRYIGIDSLLDLTDNTVPDSLYVGRLRALVSPIPLAYNEIVKDRIQLYVGKQRELTSRILGKSQYYFPFIEEELIKAELPIELRAMPIIESALISTATSRAGAVGLWQFMPTTAKSYGLEVNSLVDERRDPHRSTQAAVRYLRDLYNLYGDWTLAIAAYNCGPGNVNKAIARSGTADKSHSFWDIYYYLPRETRGYVPAFIGATYAYAYHRQHNIDLHETPIPIAVDTIRVNRLLHFGQIASTIDLPIETLRQLNPQYKLDIIPGTTKTYTLVLPQRNIAQYIAHEQEIHAKDSTYLKEYMNPVNLNKKLKEGLHGTTYTVRKGDTLGGIARRYHVTVAQLMRWNNIRNAKALRIGQRLRVG